MAVTKYGLPIVNSTLKKQVYKDEILGKEKKEKTKKYVDTTIIA